VRAGVLAVADGLVAPRAFWDALQQLAARADWLRATFGLASRPRCYGFACADGGALNAGFHGTWQTPPRLTLIVAASSISEESIESALSECFSPASAPPDGDPFPRWEPGDPLPTAKLGHWRRR
jgi:hypothetical protein